MTPSVQEFNSVDELVDPLVEDLIARNVCYIEDVDAVEDKYFLALGHVLAGAALPEFGLADDIAMVSKAQRGEADLRIIASAGPTYETLQVLPY